MRRCGQDSFSYKVFPVIQSQVLYDGRQIICPEIHVHIGDFLFEVFLISFGQATHHEYMAYKAIFLSPDESQDRIDGFLLGILDKPAGVNYNSLILKGIGIMDHTDSIRIDLLHQEFRIHHIFRTTQGYYVDRIAPIRFCPHSIKFKKLLSLQPLAYYSLQPSAFSLQPLAYYSLTAFSL
jgi:hypothetical protein